MEEEEIERGSVPEDHGRAELVQRAPLVFRLLHVHMDDSVGDRLVGRRGERLQLIRAGFFLGVQLAWSLGVSCTVLDADGAHRFDQLEAEQVREEGRALNARRHFGGRYRHSAGSSVHPDLQSCLRLL